jgi:hypothetical protein
MVSPTSPAVLQWQMLNVRRDLNEHADQMIATARDQFVWRHFASKHPWIALGAAAAAGYALAPRRRSARGAGETAKETIEPATVAGKTSQPSAVAGVAAAVLAAVLPALAREGVSLASQVARQWLAQGREGPGGPLAQPQDRSAANGRKSDPLSRSQP